MANIQVVPPQAPRPQHNLFVGFISGGITDAMLTELLTTCGEVRAFKRMVTPANEPQGFGFAEFEDADGMMRAVTLLNGIELPALEEGCASETLLVKGDEKTKPFLDAYTSQKMSAEAYEAALSSTRQKIQEVVIKFTELAAKGNLGDKNRSIIPPTLHDLQEADLPEEQRSVVVSEIAPFCERVAEREREKIKERTSSAFENNFGTGHGNTTSPNTLSRLKDRWGKQTPSGPGLEHGCGNDTQVYNQPVGLVRADDDGDRDSMARGDSSPSQATHKSVCCFENIENMASQRYGFKRDPHWTEKNPQWTLEVADRAKLLKVLGGDDGVIPDRLLQELDGFLMRLGEDRDGKMVDEEFRQKARASSVEAVKIVIFKGHSRYRLYPKIPHEFLSSLHLLVECPVTVLEYLTRGSSQDFESVTDLAYSLRSRGSPFSLMNYRPNIGAVPRLPIKHQQPGDALGFRPGDWKPTAADYEAYVTRRNTLLAEKGGVAITMGGIVWRMAYDFMGLDYDNYVAEPTERDCSLEFKWASGVYTGITLSEDELDILCGTYNVYTESGHLKRKRDPSEGQTSLTSWWPRSNYWTDSGLWTRGDEEWYNKRLQAILAGKEGPKTASQWRKITKAVVATGQHPS